MQQHNNETRRPFRNKESSDTCAHHFAKQFAHEPTPKQMQNITEHEVAWHGNPISVMKTFGTLHSSLCVKERCQIVKEKFTKNNKLINSCDKICGACRHKLRFHRFKISSSSADESCEDKRVRTPSKNKKVKKKRRDSTESVESTGSNHSILSSSNSVFTCSTRKKVLKNNF